MLIKETDTLEEAFSTLKHELHRGTLDKGHPFRFVVLSTINDGKPNSRYVVLRKIDDKLNMLIYTDSRSHKVGQIISCENASLLFWNPRNRVQLRLEGKAKILNDKERINQTWAGMNEESRKAYLSRLAPGDNIDSPDLGWEWQEENKDYFTIIQFSPTEIEFLQLNADRLLRGCYKKQKDWKGQWLVP